MDNKKTPYPRNLAELWDAALQRHEQETGSRLLGTAIAKDYPLRPTSDDEILAIFAAQSKSFEMFRSRGAKLLAVLKPIVHFTCLFIDSGAEAAASMNAPGGKAIFVAVAVLLQATKGVSALYDVIEHLFQEIAPLLNRIATHLRPSTPPPSALMNILVKTCIQVLEILAMTTKYCNSDTSRIWGSISRRTKDYLHGFTGDSKIKAALEKLDFLTKNELLEAVAEIGATVRDLQPQIQFVADAAAIGSFRNWLKPPDEQPLNWEKKRCTDSCRWFFDETFESWTVQRNGVYWIYGKAGAGKSVLCSSIIDVLKEEPTITLVYFYFDFSDPAKQDCRSLAASLVFQLGTCSEACQQYLQGKTRSTSPNYDELLSMLSDLVKLAGAVYIVIDALDECPEPARDRGSARFLEHLCELDSNEKDFHLLVTSRPEGDIWALFSCVTHILNYHDAQEHNEDISSYIRSELDRKEYRWPSDVKETIRQALEDGSNGMFLWVDLQLSRLRGCVSAADVERALKELPADLTATYKHILEKIDPSSPQMERVRRVFGCVASAKRPLSTAEVVEIYTLDTDLRSSDDMDIDDYETFILERCTGLLNIVNWRNYPGDDVRRTVQFIHFSAREFLMSPKLRDTEKSAHCYSFDEYTANLVLSKICLAALDVTPSFPSILVYAGRYWRDHVSHQNELDLDGFLQRFLQEDSPSFSRWTGSLSLFDPDPSDHAIHWVVRLNLSHYLNKLLAQSQFDQSPPMRSILVTIRCSQNRTLLHHAASAGSVDAFSLLLDYGALGLINDTDEDGNTPLHLNAKEGNLDLMRMLLEHLGVDGAESSARIDARNNQGQTAFHCAAWSHTAEAGRFLLEHGALVDVTDKDGNTPLHVGAANGNLEIIQMLLEHPRADAEDPGDRIHARNKQGQTALHCSAREGKAEAVRLLLERGALVDVTDEDGDTPLHVGASNGNLDIIQMLLEHPRADAEDPGARIHARNKYQRTALHVAARSYRPKGKAEAVRLLLERGALVDVTDKNGNTPFHLSALKGNLDIMEMLLEHPEADAEDLGARIHARNKWGHTVLHHAARCEEVEACRLLLERGALVDDVDKAGNTPSHSAVWKWMQAPDAICFLLEYRAKQNLGGLPRAHKLRNQLRRRAEGYNGELWRPILIDFASQFEAVEVNLAETWFVDV
ncbi:unnamed protein product [Peniophora sp. CBMAI 1063]|nr:unnamed protein product [Peniophora sp. CBMAI 1063]